ncbi:hypothetical protein [Klebsiella spallanzanii]|uniref:hypothetical protein n=1 Tax=Klebsiella spallanzanii TaxID=2587528 RepID=UPI00115776FC|nr:hypothetical protein [Klebsiella spallanzanii]VUS22372.1 hypothetical protein SB6419_00141 [Klebsiella spallanzanii]
MRELTTFEIDAVSGAGWLQDGLASIGSQLGSAVWSAESSLLNIELPIVGKINLATFAPNLGKTVGETLGSSIGGSIENSLSSLPNLGGFFTKLFAN